MTEKRLLRPEQSLLLKVADYFDEGHFCRGDFWRTDPDGKMLRCPVSAIDMLGRTNQERRAARARLAEHLASIHPDCRVSFTNGSIDAEETIFRWVDDSPLFGRLHLDHKAAAAMVRWAAGVLPEQHTPTAIVDSEDAG